MKITKIFDHEYLELYGIWYPYYDMRHNKDTMKVNIIVIYLPLVHLCYVGRSVMEYMTS